MRPIGFLRKEDGKTFVTNERKTYVTPYMTKIETFVNQKVGVSLNPASTLYGLRAITPPKRPDDYTRRVCNLGTQKHL
jgi:hypothetical protein